MDALRQNGKTALVVLSLGGGTGHGVSRSWSGSEPDHEISGTYRMRTQMNENTPRFGWEDGKELVGGLNQARAGCIIENP